MCVCINSFFLVQICINSFEANNKRIYTYLFGKKKNLYLLWKDGYIILRQKSSI